MLTNNGNFKRKMSDLRCPDVVISLLEFNNDFNYFFVRGRKLKQIVEERSRLFHTEIY